MRAGPSGRGDRGVALLIVLLITALLTALVFEFAYAARVSLREAVNFRDSRRAYFLARAGVNLFVRYQELRESVPHGEWTVVPMVSAGDTELRIRWEDEEGKLAIGRGLLATDENVYGWLERLFGEKGIAIAELDALKDHFKGRPVQLPGELREILSDEAYAKVASALTVYANDSTVNVNTAPDDVLRSMGIEPALIVPLRPVERRENIPAMDIRTRRNQNVRDFLDVSSATFRVLSHATVGEYTKQVEAVVQGGAIHYWRAW